VSVIQIIEKLAPDGNSYLTGEAENVCAPSEVKQPAGRGRALSAKSRTQTPKVIHVFFNVFSCLVIGVIFGWGSRKLIKLVTLFLLKHIGFTVQQTKCGLAQKTETRQSYNEPKIALTGNEK
jgi:hypothetical protein